MSKRIRYSQKWYVIHVMDGSKCIDKIKVDAQDIKTANSVGQFMRFNASDHIIAVSEELEQFLRNH